MADTAEIEALLARAVAQINGSGHSDLRDGEAILDALDAAGFVIAPKEPAPQMLEAAQFHFDAVGVTTEIPSVLGYETYHVMLSARPK